VPLREAVLQLHTAFQNFFQRWAKRPRFKKKTNRQAATFTKAGFSVQGNGFYLAKIGIIKPIWSRPLPSTPSSVFELFSHMPQQARVLKKFKTVIKDCAGRYFLSFGAIHSTERVGIPRDGWQM